MLTSAHPRRSRFRVKLLRHGAPQASLSLALLALPLQLYAQALRDAAIMAVAALPLGIGVGILKYRLYEIDGLISRTISYTLLTGLLAGVFVGVVVFAGDVLPFSSPIAVAASTLAAAALFNPLRLRLQRLVDRRFNRARYDAEATVTDFSSRLRDAIDVEAMRGELLVAVSHAIEPQHTSVWLRQG